MPGTLDRQPRANAVADVKVVRAMLKLMSSVVSWTRAAGFFFGLVLAQELAIINASSTPIQNMTKTTTNKFAEVVNVKGFFQQHYAARR